MRDVIEPDLFAVGPGDALHGDFRDILDRKLADVALAREADRRAMGGQPMRDERSEACERAAGLRGENLLQRRALRVVGLFIDI